MIEHIHERKEREREITRALQPWQPVFIRSLQFSSGLQYVFRGSVSVYCIAAYMFAYYGSQQGSPDVHNSVLFFRMKNKILN